MSGRLSLAQVAVYGAIGVVVLLLGIQAFRGPATAEESGPIRLAGEPVGSGASASDSDLVVHVAGAVGDPGVYRMPAGARVADAVERAGGPSSGAAADGINLAARLADGQQVVVPDRNAAAAGTAAADGPISLGSATALDLEQIEGIGPVTAEAIIAYRDEQGGVASVEELDAVSGIGPATLDSLAARLQP